MNNHKPECRRRVDIIVHQVDSDSFFLFFLFGHYLFNDETAALTRGNTHIHCCSLFAERLNATRRFSCKHTNKSIFMNSSQWCMASSFVCNWICDSAVLAWGDCYLSHYHIALEAPHFMQIINIMWCEEKPPYSIFSEPQKVQRVNYYDYALCVCSLSQLNWWDIYSIWRGIAAKNDTILRTLFCACKSRVGHVLVDCRPTEVPA